MDEIISLELGTSPDNIIEVTPSPELINLLTQYGDNIENSSSEQTTQIFEQMINEIENMALNITENTTELNNNMDEQNECYICSDELNSENITILDCGHKFHEPCIEMSYKNANNTLCPYCRQPSKQILSQKCKGIIKSGKNKGKQCSFNPKYGVYCGKHRYN